MHVHWKAGNSASEETEVANTEYGGLAQVYGMIQQWLTATHTQALGDTETATEVKSTPVPFTHDIEQNQLRKTQRSKKRTQTNNGLKGNLLFVTLNKRKILYWGKGWKVMPNNWK